MKSLQNKTMPSCCFPPQVETHLQGHHISAGCAAGLEASAGPKGSGSADSCIIDNSGEEIYLSSTSTAVPRTFLTPTGSTGTVDVQETASLQGMWWAEAPCCCCLRSDRLATASSLASWS